MKARLQVSKNAIELIKRFEGYRANAAQLADGRWTIGYGHTLTARKGAHVSVEDAAALLMYDLIAVAHAVNEHSYTPLNQNQFDALTSLAFNIGMENFKRSAVLRWVNEGALIQAACAMDMWRKADFAGERIVIDALVRRRSAEKNLFLTPPEGWVAAPSPILPPKVDYDASYAVPRQAPSPVTASLEGDLAEAHRDGTSLPVPVPPDEDAEPTASERAAVAVSAQLESLLPEDVAPVSQSEASVEPQPDVVDETLLSPLPLGETATFDVPPIPESPLVEPSQAAEPLTRALDWPAPFLAPTPQEQGQIESQVLAEEQPAAVPEANPPQDFPLASAPEVQSEPAPLDASNALWNAGLDDDQDVVASFDATRPRGRKPHATKSAPLFILAFISLIFVAGGVFGGLSTASDASGTLRTEQIISWILCVGGAVGFVIATYRILRLLDAPEN